MIHQSLEVDSEPLKAHIKSINEAAEINKKLYNQEMTNHEFLDHNYRIQRTTFADGTQITVDFDKNTYEVKTMG